MQRRTQPYGDLAETGPPGPIRRAVGAELLAHILDEFLSRLGSSGAVYEADGRYAMGLFASGWCRFMDQASRALVRTSDNEEALQSEHWHCHRSCWEISKQAIEGRVPADRPCRGGLRIYAVPVLQEDTVIGAVNFAYGEPPTEAQALSELAGRYRVDEGTLAELAAAHRPVESEVVEEVKRRLATAARIIGELVGRRDAERKRVELQERVRRAEKLESLGVLAGGVAHDFNNILVGVLSNAELLAEQLHGEPRGLAQSIQQAALLARQLCAQMLTYAGHTRVERQPVDLGVLVRQNLEILRAALGGRFRLLTDSSHDLPCILGDSAGLQQIVMNLAINAAEATGESGTVWIRTGVTTLGTRSDDFILLGEPKPGRHAYLEVEDRGSGIAPEEIERICEPFHSSKGTGRGLGMASVLGIVRNHGGVVGIESELGRGTRIRIFLPPTEAVALSSSVHEPADVRQTAEAKPTVLVVDDEELVRRTCEVVLKKHGYRVVSCSSGDQALDAFDADPSRFAVALVDRTMPKMVGTELVEALRKRRSDFPVVLMSGFSRQQDSPLDVRHLSKPFRAQELLASLREVVERSRSRP